MNRPPTEQQVDPILLSMVRLELLAFFQANPYTRDTVEGLARRLHRPIPVIALAASSLAALGILASYQGSNITIYGLKTGQFPANEIEKTGESMFFPAASSNQPRQSKRNEGKESRDQFIS